MIILKNEIKLIVSLLVLTFIISCASDTSATSLPSWGAQSDNIAQNGAAWYHYKMTKSEDSYNDNNAVIYVPTGDANVEKTAIPAKTCRRYGGFWVLLNNGFKNDEYTGEPYSAAQVSDISLNDVGQKYTYVATDNINYVVPRTPAKDSNDLEFVEYGRSMDEILTKYTALVSTTAVPDYAKGNIGELRYFCYGDNDKNEPIEFSNFSTVSVGSGNSSSAPVLNGASFLSNSLVVAGEESITFNHYIAKTTDQDLTGDDQIKYRVTSKKIIRDSGNNIVWEREEPVNDWEGIGATSLNNTTESPLDRIDIESLNYYAYKIPKTMQTGELSEGYTYTYCQTIESTGSYGSSDFNIISSGERRSMACVTIKPVISSSGVVTDCNYKKDGLFMDDEFFGNTVATVGISKNDNLTDENITTAFARDDTVTIYAKPGDIAQFSYALCFGAHGVRDLSAKGVKFMSGDNVDKNGKLQSDYELENSFEVNTNAPSNDGEANYLFGRADAFLGDAIVVSNADARQKDLKKIRDNSVGEVSCAVDASACANQHHDCEMDVSDDDSITEGIPKFSSTENYSTDDVVVYKGSIYKAKRNISPDESMVWDEELERYVFNYNLWEWVSYTGNGVPQCAWVDTGATGGSFYGTSGQLAFYEDRNFYDVQKDKNEVIFASPDSKRGSARFDVTSIVGSTLSQTLSYNYLAFWPSKLCNGASCIGCSMDDDKSSCYFGVSKLAYYTQGEDILQQEWFSSDEEYERALEAYRLGADTHDKGIFELGWFSTPENYKRALNSYNRGYNTIPSDAYNIGYGAYQTDNETINKTAKVVVPYNFDTNLSMEMDGYLDGTIYPGDVVNIKAKIDILPRVNPLTSSVDDSGKLIPYATATPANTKVELIELLIPETVDIDDSKERSYSDGEKIHPASLKQILNSEVDPYNKNSICSMYSSYLGDDLGECRTTTVAGNAGSLNNLPYTDELKKVGNADSNPAGEMGYFDTDKWVTYKVLDENGKPTNTTETAQINKLERAAPDAEAGYKYCVAVGINHGDSHNASGQILEANQYLEDGKTLNPKYAANSYSVGSSVGGNVPASWKVSKFSCRTIVKKPNYQVWNGGVYSSGKISGAVSYKAVNTKVNLNKTSNDPIYKDKKNAGKFTAPASVYFGSWAEYLIVSRGDVLGVASASALGYTSPTKPWQTEILDSNGKPIIIGYKENGEEIHMTREHISYFADTGLSVSSDTDFCSLARLTISNTTCKKGKAGNYIDSDAATDTAYLEDFKQRIMNYYTNSELGNNFENAPGVIYGENDNNSISESEFEDMFSRGAASYAKQNGADYLKVRGNYTINSPIVRDMGSGTLVIEVDGHLTIDKNICLLDDGFCRDGSNDTWKSDYDQNTNNLSLAARNAGELSGISSIPQIILIAEDIEIGSEVTQIDAWLITNSRDGDYNGGYINTCKEFVNDKTGADSCWKTLKVNGPVITSALFLNRTGGAWPGYSGDVGNQAYDTLNANIQTAVDRYTGKIMEQIKAGVNSSSLDLEALEPFNHTEGVDGQPLYDLVGTSDKKGLLDTFKDNTRKYITSCQETSNTTLEGCIEKKIVKQLKKLYPYTISNDRNNSQRKAYENAANYYAAWDSFSGWDNNPINNDKKDAKDPSSRDLTCDGSITPAEIFDLNPLVYYWALAESQKNNKAFVTYAQEFAPRY